MTALTVDCLPRKLETSTYMQAFPQYEKETMETTGLYLNSSGFKRPLANHSSPTLATFSTALTIHIT